VEATTPYTVKTVSFRNKAVEIAAHLHVPDDVTFEAVEGASNDAIDAAYRAKYRKSPYLEPMIGARARAATVRIAPRGND